MPKPFIIVVCGGSGSGKTTLIKHLTERLRLNFQVAHMATDDYYKDLSYLPHQVRRQSNFDHPDALDLRLFLDQLAAVQCGQAIEVPQYEFTSHTRVGSRRLDPPEVLLVDGIFALSPDGIEKVVDFSIFLDIPDAMRFQRRLKRDQEERGRSHEEVVRQYNECVRPMYDKYIAPTAIRARRRVTYEEQVGSTLVEQLLGEILAMIGPRCSK